MACEVLPAAVEHMQVGLSIDQCSDRIESEMLTRCFSSQVDAADEPTSEDLYTRMKTLQRQLEFLDIQGEAMQI